MIELYRKKDARIYLLAGLWTLMIFAVGIVPAVLFAITNNIEWIYLYTLIPGYYFVKLVISAIWGK